MFSREESAGKSGGRMLSHWENPKVPRWGRGKIPKCRRSDIAHLENPLKQVAGQGMADMTHRNCRPSHGSPEQSVG